MTIKGSTFAPFLNEELAKIPRNFLAFKVTIVAEEPENGVGLRTIDFYFGKQRELGFIVFFDKCFDLGIGAWFLIGKLVGRKC